MDLPKHKRSLSLCCSDKLALFNLLGLQGSRLFNVIVTIYIDRLIVDGREGGKKQLTEGINFVTRLARLKQRPLKTIVRKLFNLVVENQERVISRQFKANRPQIDYFL